MDSDPVLENTSIKRKRVCVRQEAGKECKRAKKKAYNAAYNAANRDNLNAKKRHIILKMKMQIAHPTTTKKELKQHRPVH